MFINRLLINEILTKLSAERSKIIVIYGPRQVCKTTLANDVLKLLNKKTMFIDCDSFKWGKAVKAPESWINSYQSDYLCVNKNNFVGFVC